MTFSAAKGVVVEEQSDISVVFHFSDSKILPGALGATDKALDGFMSMVLEDEHFTGKKGQSLIVHTHDKLPATRVLVMGLEKKRS